MRDVSQLPADSGPICVDDCDAVGEVLVLNGVGFVAALSEQGGQPERRVLVELELHAAVGDSAMLSSRASAAAYSNAA